MSGANPAPTPLPHSLGRSPGSARESQGGIAVDEQEAFSNESTPLFRLHLNDLSHPASSQFLNLVDGAKVLPNALAAIRKYLYFSHPSYSSTDKKLKFQLPATRSVTVIFRPMGGVAYTTGMDIDSSHKEIHVSLDYLNNCTNDSNRRRHEIIGVITHEMVHCYQYNGEGAAPGGLIEGIADFVRLKASLGPPHWFGDKGKRSRGDKWDAGYQQTAFFLDWLEEIYGVGTVGGINDALRTARYDESKGFWEALFGPGKTIQVLWADYCKAQDEPHSGRITIQTAPPPAVPTCASDQPPSGGEEGSDIAPPDSPTTRSTPSHESDDIVVVEKE